MDLKQKYIAKVMKEAGEQIALIDANIGLIAEAEGLSAALRKEMPEKTHTGNPVLNLTSTRASVWVQFSYVRRSAVITAIERAGLKIASETLEPDDSRDSSIRLEGLQAYIYIASPPAELAEAA